MEIKDIAGLSEPLTKLIQVFEDGCSWLVQPYQIKRIAKAQAEANEIMKASEFKIQLQQSLLSDTNAALHNAREKRQRQNIANIYSMAAQELESIKEVNDETVSSEWSSLFFDLSKDVCDEDIQIIWAKLLAEEVASPNSIMKRTLMTLKGLESFEAKCFTEICSFVIEGSFFLNLAIDLNLITYHQIMALVSCGLIHAGTYGLQYNLSKDTIDFKTLRLKRIDHNDVVNMPDHFGYLLTNIGQQIYSIVKTETNLEFVKSYKSQLEKHGPSYCIEQIVE